VQRARLGAEVVKEMAIVVSAAGAGLVILLILVASDWWVYEDAKSCEARGRPVHVTLGSFHLDTPATWGIACLVLWVFFFPLYLTGRSHA
jgi:hypothetical protein